MKEAGSGMRTRSSIEGSFPKEERYFFCGEPAGTSGFHNASTSDIDMKVHRCAMELKDADLLAKLASGDLITLEAKYYSICLPALYNRARS